MKFRLRGTFEEAVSQTERAGFLSRVEGLVLSLSKESEVESERSDLAGVGHSVVPRMFPDEPKSVRDVPI